MTDLHGRTAIVTGSARGLGRAIAVRLGRRVAIRPAASSTSRCWEIAWRDEVGRCFMASREQISNPVSGLTGAATPRPSTPRSSQ